MAYRDEVDRVLRENEEIRKALANARSDARFTAIRQVLLAFAFGLSWSILGSDASADQRVYDDSVEPPPGHGWLEIRPDAGWVFDIDGRDRASGDLRMAVVPGRHRVRFFGPYGERCTFIDVRDGRTSWAYNVHAQACR